MKVGQPPRPIAEARLVYEAVAGRTGPRAPLARALARDVVCELSTFISEDDAALIAFGELRRALIPSPARSLATDPDIDTLALYVEARVARLRSRNGRANSSAAEDAEHRAILRDVERLLIRRYLRHLRSSHL